VSGALSAFGVLRKQPAHVSAHPRGLRDMREDRKPPLSKAGSDSQCERGAHPALSSARCTVASDDGLGFSARSFLSILSLLRWRGACEYMMDCSPTVRLKLSSCMKDESTVVGTASSPSEDVCEVEFLACTSTATPLSAFSRRRGEREMDHNDGRGKR
jgi:hypothetical protein